MYESWVVLAPGTGAHHMPPSGHEEWAPPGEKFRHAPGEREAWGKVVRVAGAPTVTGYLPSVVRSTARDRLESLELTLPQQPCPGQAATYTRRHPYVDSDGPRHCR